MSRRYRERLRIDYGRVLPNFIAMSELPRSSIRSILFR